LNAFDKPVSVNDVLCYYVGSCIVIFYNTGMFLGMVKNQKQPRKFDNRWRMGSTRSV
jgi:hypothetical protein